jgi:class 3 adenylate cyclase/ActR/RegA family two-component response regulator
MAPTGPRYPRRVETRAPDSSVVTFLFTDVEGSTRLAERFPRQAPEILARHHALIAEAAGRHGGRVFEQLGDAAYVAFDDAAEAIMASTEMSGALAQHDWGDVGRVRVRAAIDTGDVKRQGHRFFGAPLFRASRILSLAHGGETLVSDEALSAARGRLPDGVRPRDMGEHHLRDLTEPVHIHQLLHTAAESSQGEAAVTGDGAIRVMLVDDHLVVRRGLRGFLELLRDIEVVGEAADGAQAVALADRLRPDVILMDLLMPVMDGLTAIARIKEAQPEVEIVAVTSFIEEEKVIAALEAGAAGYLLKDAEPDEVANAIRKAHAGEMLIDPAVAKVLAERLRARG